MDTVQSFKGYDKVDELEASAFRKKLRRRLIILSVTLVVLISLIAGIVTGVLVHRRNSNGGSNSPSSAIQTVCAVTPYPEACAASLSSSNLSDPEKLFEIMVSLAMSALEKVAHLPEEYAKKKSDNPLVLEAARVCGEVLTDAVDFLNDTISDGGGGSGSESKIDDMRTWLSTVVTNHETCFDALEEANATFVGDVRSLLGNSTTLASNCLAIVSKLLGLLDDFKIPFGGRRRRLMAAEEDDGFPEWVSEADRRILEAATPDVIVSKDGVGGQKIVRTLKEAIERIPITKKKNAMPKRFVILVKKGVYNEKVEINKKQKNVMLLGDGMGQTIITGHLNFVDGTPTFQTASFVALGEGFMARDVTFRNTAGAEKHQAVAVRCGADLAAFYRCSFLGFQDTLYTHSNRQFLRECEITGTIDFIFGNAAVVFQKCKILSTKPLPNQFNTVTAQGRTDANQNTGIVISGCVIRTINHQPPTTTLINSSFVTYLGRPWKPHSRTVIMYSNISAAVDSQGWVTWTNNATQVPESTVMYAEFMNTGPGSLLKDRVNWINKKFTNKDAANFYVDPFINARFWLNKTGVPYDLY